MKEELVGKTFGKLTVESVSDTKRSNGERMYNCVCECGNGKVVAGSSLKTGHTTSCGCMKGKRNAETSGPGPSKATVAAFVAARNAKNSGGVPVEGAPLVYRAAEQVPIEAVGVVKNVRRGEITPESDPKILELAESIRQVGILEPLIVNFVQDAQPASGVVYELIAGHRRLAAAKIAECQTVPAIIYDNLDGRAVLEIQISENLHRVDLRPTEIADTYCRMRNILGLPVEEIARRIGKSPAHVYQYMQLAMLPEDALAKIDEGEIGIAKALILCTLPKSLIDRVLNDSYIMDTPARDFLARVKSHYMQNLKNCVFKKDKEYEDKNGKVWPSCKKCADKKHGNEFDGNLGADDCPNRECFIAKQNIENWAKSNSKKLKEIYGDVDLDEDDVEPVYRELTDEEKETLDRVREEKFDRGSAERQAKWDMEREEREAKQYEARKPETIKLREKTDWYIERIFGANRRPIELYFGMHDDDSLDGRDRADREALDELYKKYIGMGIADMKVAESCTAIDVLKAAVIIHIYGNMHYDDSDIAKAFGVDPHPEDVEEEDAETDNNNSDDEPEDDADDDSAETDDADEDADDDEDEAAA